MAGSNVCTYCGEAFHEGDNILIHDYPNGQLTFCGSNCAGNWFAENECTSITYQEEE